MILILLLLGIVLFIAGFLLLPTKRQRFFGGSLGLILVLVMAILMIGNDNWHWGMHHATTTKTVKIASISPSKKLNVLVYQPIRQAKTEKVYVYRLTGQTKQRHTAASLKTTNRVTYTTTTQAKLVTKTTHWVYNNSAWQWLFSWTGKHHEYVSQQNTFILPNSWTTLSTHQAKWLASAVKQKEASAQAAMKQAVTTAVTAAKTAQPSMTQAQLKAVQQQAEKKVTQQAQSKEATILAQLIKQAKQQAVK